MGKIRAGDGELAQRDAVAAQPDLPDGVRALQVRLQMRRSQPCSAIRRFHSASVRPSRHVCAVNSIKRQSFAGRRNAAGSNAGQRSFAAVHLASGVFGRAESPEKSAFSARMQAPRSPFGQHTAKIFGPVGQKRLLRLLPHPLAGERRAERRAASDRRLRLRVQ